MAIRVDAVDRVAAAVGVGVQATPAERALAVGAEEAHDDGVIGPVAAGDIPAGQRLTAFAGIAIGAVCGVLGLGAVGGVVAAAYAVVGFQAHAALGIAAEQGDGAHVCGDAVEGEQGAGIADALEHIAASLFVGEQAAAVETAGEGGAEDAVGEVAAGVVAVVAGLAVVLDAGETVLGVPGQLAAQGVSDHAAARVIVEGDGRGPAGMAVGDGLDLGGVLGGVAEHGRVGTAASEGAIDLLVAVEAVEAEDLLGHSVAKRVFGCDGGVGGVEDQAAPVVVVEGLLTFAATVFPDAVDDLIKVGVQQGLLAGAGAAGRGDGEGAGMLAAEAVVGKGLDEGVAGVGGGDGLDTGEGVEGEGSADVILHMLFQAAEAVVLVAVVAAVAVDEALAQAVEGVAPGGGVCLAIDAPGVLERFAGGAVGHGQRAERAAAGSGQGEVGVKGEGVGGLACGGDAQQLVVEGRFVGEGNALAVGQHVGLGGQLAGFVVEARDAPADRDGPLAAQAVEGLLADL